jgi:ribonuclease Z
MTFELTILGTSAAVPYHDRWLSAQVLNVQNKYILIDCGEGTQFRLKSFHIRQSKIDIICISHLHGDHIYGLFGILTSMAMHGRKETLQIFSPKGAKEMVDIVFKNTDFISPYPIHFTEVDTNRYEKIFEDNILIINAFPLKHRIPTTGYLISEKPFSLNIKPDKIKELNIPFDKIKEIKNGADLLVTEGGIQRTIPNGELTFPPPKPRSFAYCSDTAYAENIIPFIKNVDLLYHEATFLQDMHAHATLTGHSTAKQAGEIARLAGAGQLILGHYSSRYNDLDWFLTEAKEAFENTVLGIDGKVYSVGLNRDY